MAKIYGTPIMAGGGGGMNKDLPPLLDNFKAKSIGSVPISLGNEGVVEFSTLPSGTKVRMTPNNPYYAVVTHSRTDNNDMAIVYDATTVDLSDVPDSSKMENDSDVEGFDGSDFQKWLSGTTSETWFSETAQNVTAPSYSNIPGFLYRVGLSRESVLTENFNKIHMKETDSGSFAVIHCDETKKYDFFPEDLAYNDGPYYIYTADGTAFGIQYDMSSSDQMSTYAPISTLVIQESPFPQNGLFHVILGPKPTTKVKQNGDEYYFFEEGEEIELSADKMAVSRANELAGAVWVYGDHEPESVNDGTKIQLSREEVVGFGSPETVSTLSTRATEESQPITELASGSKIKLGKWNGTDLQWKVARDTSDQSIRLVLEPTSVSLLGNMQYDAPEPSNSDSDRRSYGNNRYIYSNIHQWLNATEVSEWYTAQHSADAAPSYVSSPGFLSGWNENHIAALDRATLTTSRANVDGGGTETFVARVALISTTELGLQSSTGGGRLDIFNADGDRATGAYYWARTPYPSNSDNAYLVADSGGLSGDIHVYSAYGVRPLCIPKSATHVSLQPDSDGCYTIVGAEPEYAQVTRTIQWDGTKNFYARQFTYNSKKQYQTMLEGAVTTIVFTGIPAPVTELAEQHSGSSITLTWKNPVDDEFYNRTVVMYSTEAFPTSINEGTQGYSGTGETCTLEGLDLGNTYYISVFTVSEQDTHGEGDHVSVEIPAGQLISSLASGTKVKLGKWNNTDLQWKVARDTTDQSLRLVLEPTSVTLLGTMQWDAAEPSNSDSNRQKYGNNRYIYSNIHQWLNATKAVGWYTAQHSADTAPAYASSAGFLSGWSENHLNALDRPTLTVSRSKTDGGGTETFVSRVALMSTTELGLESGTGNGRLDIFNSDGDRATGSVYWTRTPYPSNSYSVRPVGTAGGLIMLSNAYGAFGVRPLCSPKSTALVSLEIDDDNCYVVQ